MSAIADLAGRLESLYPVESDPRITWLPDEPDAFEVHVRGDGSCDLVVGYTGERFDAVDAFVSRCLRRAADHGAPDHREAWASWVRAAPRVLDAGAQLSADLSRLQVYLRGRFGPAPIERAFAAFGTEADTRVVRNALALFSASSVEMIGLELCGRQAGAAVYLSVPNRNRDDAAVITDLVAFLLGAQLPGTPAASQWRDIAAELLVTPDKEWVYVSFEPVRPAGWAKVDVGARPLALAGSVASAVGAGAEPMLQAASDHGFDPVDHIGVRFGNRRTDVSVYGSLL